MMGSWGYRPFDNDSSSHFVYDFEQRGVPAVLDAMNSVLNAEYVEAPDADSAIAAAAFIATADGHSNWLSESARSAFAGRTDVHDLVRLKPLARDVLTKIRQPGTEWMQLWQEAGPDDFKGALQSLDQLLADLN